MSSAVDSIGLTVLLYCLGEEYQKRRGACALSEVELKENQPTIVLPLASGLLDWYENRLQHLFLSASDFATIVDPLPLYSTVASDVKWLLSAVYVSLAVFLLFRLYLKGHRNAGD